MFDDQLIEGDEDFTGELVFPLGVLKLGGELLSVAPAVGEISEAKGLILDDDVQSSTVFFSQTEYDFNENDGTVTITVNRGGNTSGAGPSATRPVPCRNQMPRLQTRIIPPPAGRSLFRVAKPTRPSRSGLRMIKMPNPTKASAVSLLSPSSALKLREQQYRAGEHFIDNDYAPGHVSFSATNYNAVEGSVATFTVDVPAATSVFCRLITPLRMALPLRHSIIGITVRHSFWTIRKSGAKTIQIPITDNGLAEGNRTSR